MSIPSSYQTGTGAADAAGRARTLLQLRRPDAAEREARGALARDPQHPEAHAMLALALSALRRADEALAEANEAVRLAPDSWLPHYVAGHVLLNAGQARAGLPAAWAALRVDPGKAVVWKLVTRLHLKLNECWLAAQAAHRGLTHDPEDSDLASLQSLALADLALAPGAATLAAQAVRLNPEEPLAHLAVGHAALVAGDPGTAARAFREALRLDPGNEHAREWLVIALKQRDPVYRSLYQALRGFGKQRLRLPLALWAVLFIVLAAANWALWTADAVQTLRLARDPSHRRLLHHRQVRAAWLSAAAVAAGFAALAAGPLTGRAGIASAGVALAALVTPIQETGSGTAPPGRMILGGWAALLTLATAALVVLSAVSPDAAPLGVPVALLAVLTIWPARWVRLTANRPG